MIKQVICIGLSLSLFGLMSAVTVGAEQPQNKKTVLTFSQPVEIPGRVLPAGTYTFQLADSMTDRHIVQILNADGSQILATVMAIPDYRLTPTDETVITFKEVPRGSPEAIRAWFYPGNVVGQELVYPKPRAAQLARLAKTAVPAIAVDVADLDAMKIAPIIAVTPDARELPVEAAIQTTPVETGAPAAHAAATGRTALPRTASTLPMIALFGVASIGLAVLLTFFRRPVPEPASTL